MNSGHVVETSLGYFINPLLTILLGVLVLKERLTRTQWIAVGIASLAIVVLTVDYGRLPWIALTLAVSFGCYGFLKKQVSAGAVESLAVETAVMAVPALITLIVLAEQSRLTFGHARRGQRPAAGRHRCGHRDPAAAVRRRRPPAAADHDRPAAVPGTGAAVRGRASGIRHEPMPLARLLGFVLVWIALVVLTADALTRRRRASELAQAATAVAA